MCFGRQCRRGCCSQPGRVQLGLMCCDHRFVHRLQQPRGVSATGISEGLVRWRCPSSSPGLPRRHRRGVSTIRCVDSLDEPAAVAARLVAVVADDVGVVISALERQHLITGAKRTLRRPSTFRGGECAVQQAQRSPPRPVIVKQQFEEPKAVRHTKERAAKFRSRQVRLQ